MSVCDEIPIVHFISEEEQTYSIHGDCVCEFQGGGTLDFYSALIV